MRRFELTIPLKKRLRVRYRHIMRRAEIIEVIGYPLGARQSVIYVGEPGGLNRPAQRLTIVPIACLVSIEALKTAEDNAW